MRSRLRLRRLVEQTRSYLRFNVRWQHHSRKRCARFRLGIWTPRISVTSRQFYACCSPPDRCTWVGAWPSRNGLGTVEDRSFVRPPSTYLDASSFLAAPLDTPRHTPVWSHKSVADVRAGGRDTSGCRDLRGRWQPPPWSKRLGQVPRRSRNRPGGSDQPRRIPRNQGARARSLSTGNHSHWLYPPPRYPPTAGGAACLRRRTRRQTETAGRSHSSGPSGRGATTSRTANDWGRRT